MRFVRESCRRFVLLLVVLMWLAAAGLAAPPERQIVPGDIANEYVVGLKGVAPSDVDKVAAEIAARSGGRVVRLWRHALTGFLVRIADEHAHLLLRDARVKAVEQNVRLVRSGSQQTGWTTAPLPPEGTCSPYPYCVQPSPAGTYAIWHQPHPLWHLARISHRASTDPDYGRYDYISDGKGVTAYVVDSGVLRFHQEFADPDTNVTSSHLNPAESSRVKEIFEANLAAAGGRDVLPSSAPHPDCGMPPPFGEPLDGRRWWWPTPWYDPTVAGGFGRVAGNADHGTGVAAILGGLNIGVAKEVTIVPVKAIGCGADADAAYLINSLEWVLIKEKAKSPRQPAVVSISIARVLCDAGLCDGRATDLELQMLEQALAALTENGIPVFASANNFQKDACSNIPPRMSRRGGRGKVITVGGLEKDRDRRWYGKDNGGQAGISASNHGVCVDIMAPAENMPVPWSKGWSAYRSASTAPETASLTSGTSYAAPIVAGIAARLLSEDPDLWDELNNTTSTDDERVTDNVWQRIAASATRLPEVNGAVPSDYDGGDPNSPDLRNSPNLIAYAGPLTITAQPQSKDIPLNTTTELEVGLLASVTPTRYEWYVAPDGDYDTQNAAAIWTGPTFTVPAFRAPGRSWYFARVFGDCGGQSCYSTTAMAAVSSGCAVVTKHPQNWWAVDHAAGAALPVLSVEVQSASPSMLTYAWYRGDRGDLSDPVQVTTPTLQVTEGMLTPGLTGTFFWVRVTGAGGCVVDSDVAQVRSCVAPPGLQWAQNQPGATTGLTYEWIDSLSEAGDTKDTLKISYSGTAGSNTIYTVMTGDPMNPTELGESTAFPLQVQPTTHSAVYWVSAVNQCGWRKSEELTIEAPDCEDYDMFATGNALPPAVTPCITKCENPLGEQAGAVYKQDAVTLTTPRYSGRASSYTWYRSDLGAAAQVTLGTTTVPSYQDVPPKTSVYRHRLRFVQSGCPSIEKLSDPVLVMVRPVIVSHPADTACVNGAAKLIVTATDDTDTTLEYKWYEQNAAGAFVAVDDSETITGAATRELTVRNVTQPRVFRVRVTNSFKFTPRGKSTPQDYSSFTDSKPAVVRIGCGSPKRRAVSKPSIPGAGANSPDILSVVEPESGVTYDWYWGDRYIFDAAHYLGTGTSIELPLPLHPAYVYRAKITCEGQELVTFSEIIYLDACHALSVDGPADATGSGSVAAAVIAYGSGPFLYEWLDAATNALIGTGTTYTFASSTPATRQVKVGVTDPCGKSVTSRTATLQVTACEKPVIGAYWGNYEIYVPGSAREVGVAVNPPSHPNVTFSYEWFKGDGTPISGTGPTRLVTTYHMDSFFVRVTSKCGENSTAFIDSPKFYLSVYGECALPPLHVAQTTSDGNAGPVVFTVQADWPGMQFQWYEGQSGDTRKTAASDPGNPRQLTAPNNAVRSYWVRASRSCGASVDSPTLTYTRNDCAPILIDRHPQSVEVAYGDDAILDVIVPNESTKTFTWHEGTANTEVGSSASTIVRPAVTESRSLWVNVSEPACDTSADSFPATVRVASCATITPPQWVTEYVTEKGDTEELIATSAGAIGYQWYRGEVGDYRNLISGATSATYTTNAVTADAKYWVRVFGTNGCIVDSPTITVRMCELTVNPPLFTNEDLVRGQWARFYVDAKGTGLQYQWYEGLRGDTSKPVGRQVDKLEIQPGRTTNYWVKVSNACGSDAYISPVYTASICPTINGNPTATLTKVMPGTTTTLAIDATGDDLVYRWYKGEPGDETTFVGQGQTITTPPITQMTKFWCKVISGKCPKLSQPVTINLCDEPTVAWNMNSTIGIATGDMVTFKVNTTWSTDAPMITYYKGPKGNVAASQMVNQTTSTSFVKQVNESGIYWARATVGNCYADSSQLTVDVCIPKIIEQPAGGQYVTGGAAKVVSVNTDITPVSYEWWAGPVGNHFTSTRVSNGAGRSINVSPTADTTYWVRIKGCGTSSIDSQGALVTVCTIPQVTAQTSNQWVSQGTTLDISVTASGTGKSYQWYEGNAGVTTKPVGTNQYFLRITPAATTTYWAKVFNGCGSVNSQAITISVCAPPSVTVSPSAAMIFSGTTATFTASATVATGTPISYQWYSGTPQSPTIITGATSSTYTTPQLTSGASYFVRVTSGTCMTDKVATVGICAYPAEIHGTDDKKIQSGQTVKLDLVISPVPTAYRWYRGPSGNTSNPLTGWVASRSIDVNPTATTQYWAEVQGTDCTSKTRTITVQVCVPKITTQPASGWVMANGTKLLSVASDMPGVTYQWYSGTSGSGTAIPAATSYSYTTPALTAAANYWVKVTGSCGVSTNSDTASITICTPPAITQPPGSTSISLNTTKRLYVTATGDDLTYQWYQGTSGGGTALNGKTSSFIDVAPQTTTSYWVKVSGKCGTPLNSATATVAVCTTPTIQTQPVSQVIYSGRTAMLSVSATQPTGSPLEYQWFNAGTGQAISGATGASFTTPALTADTSYFVRVSSGGMVCHLDSSVATIRMCSYLEEVTAIANQKTYVGQTVRLDLSGLVPLPTLFRFYRGNTGDRSNPLTQWNTQRYWDVAPTTTTNYWAEFQDNVCTARTTTIKVEVCVPQITAQPQSAYVSPGGSKTLTVTSNLPGATFQWYQGSTLLTGKTSASLDTGALYANTSYWVRVSGSCGVSVDSSVATITMCSAPAITIPPYNGGNGLPGHAAGTEVTATGSNLTYQWYYGEPGDMSRPISGKTTRSMSVTLWFTEKVWVRVTGTCGAVNSTSAFLSVYPTIMEQPGDAVIDPGQTVTFNVSANGTYLRYEWYDGSDLVASTTIPSFTTPPLYEDKMYRVLVFSGTTQVWSREAYVTFNQP